jgi:peptidoglycan/xylan/chitin deacetylase (PgdA/CDA1 family)
VYRHAYPILKQMGVPATIYLPTDFIGTSRRFNHDRLFHLVRLMQQQPGIPLFDTLSPAANALMQPILSGRRSASAALDDFIEEHPTSVLTGVIDELAQRLGGGAELAPEQGDIMDWDEVRRMARDGFEFGAHTLGHTVLTHEPSESVEREIVQSKHRIEQELGTPVRDFAYCNGWYSDEIIRILLNHGFRSGVTTEDFPNVIGGDPFALKRKVLWENFSVGLFGDYSASLTRCQLDDCFGVLGVSHPVPGRRGHLARSSPVDVRPGTNQLVRPEGP